MQFLISNKGHNSKTAVTHQRISETRAGRVEKLQNSTYARHTSETRSKLVTSTLCTLGVRPARVAVCRKNHRAFRARLGSNNF